MKKFEILNHTADIRGRIYGRNMEELFVNASELLYFLMSPEFYGEKEVVAKVELSGDTSEELLVKFLNELIYYAEVKKGSGRFYALTIKKKEEKFYLDCEMAYRKIKRMAREIKAATYHNLRIKKEKGVLTASLIFDV